MNFIVYDLVSKSPVYETPKLEKAKSYAELYKKNLNKDCFVQRCETIWSTQTLDELLGELNNAKQ